MITQLQHQRVGGRISIITFRYSVCRRIQMWPITFDLTADLFLVSLYVVKICGSVLRICNKLWLLKEQVKVNRRAFSGGAAVFLSADSTIWPASTTPTKHPHTHTHTDTHTQCYPIIGPYTCSTSCPSVFVRLCMCVSVTRARLVLNYTLVFVEANLNNAQSESREGERGRWGEGGGEMQRMGLKQKREVEETAGKQSNKSRNKVK